MPTKRQRNQDGLVAPGVIILDLEADEDLDPPRAFHANTTGDLELILIDNDEDSEKQTIHVVKGATYDYRVRKWFSAGSTVGMVIKGIY